MATTPRPPAHLSKSSAAWWRQVVKEFDLEPHHLKLLQAACEAWDRMCQARDAISTQGLTIRDGNGIPKAHPAVPIERDSRLAFARLAVSYKHLTLPTKT